MWGGLRISTWPEVRISDFCKPQGVQKRYPLGMLRLCICQALPPSLKKGNSADRHLPKVMVLREKQVVKPILTTKYKQQKTRRGFRNSKETNPTEL